MYNGIMEKIIKDSGARREFNTGAVRDIQMGKGRCDLMPLKEVGMALGKIDANGVLAQVDKFMKSGNPEFLAEAIRVFVKNHTKFTLCESMIDVSRHYEQGALKYGERNWEKGIPLHSYIDSGTRHLLQHLDGKVDEPHDRAFIWNMLGAMWTMENRKEMVNIPFERLAGDKKK